MDVISVFCVCVCVCINGGELVLLLDISLSKNSLLQGAGGKARKRPNTFLPSWASFILC